ncbi:hypothetical protein PG991_012294 [Apiospora marii]|uniref:Uncharacterized protein n=1 Tax=Apiospora marii TaxID=335849 RepID=A0ABR1R9T2_9PEZI
MAWGRTGAPCRRDGEGLLLLGLVVAELKDEIQLVVAHHAGPRREKAVGRVAAVRSRAKAEDAVAEHPEVDSMRIGLTHQNKGLAGYSTSVDTRSILSDGLGELN